MTPPPPPHDDLIDVWLDTKYRYDVYDGTHDRHEWYFSFLFTWFFRTRNFLSQNTCCHNLLIDNTTTTAHERRRARMAHDPFQINSCKK